MFEDYLRSIFRALRRDKFHAALNVIGLAVALAAALLIALYVQFELSYDNFFTGPDRIFRLETVFQGSPRSNAQSGYSPYVLADALNADFSSELTATRLTGRTMVVSVGDTHVRKSTTFAEDNLFDVLDFPVAEGDATAALHNQNSVILTASTARQLFGTAKAVGKSLRLDDREVRVGAVLRDLPANTTFKFDIVAPETSPAFGLQDWMKTMWTFVSEETFVRLRPGVSGQSISDRLPDFTLRHIPKGPNGRQALVLSIRPLTDIHLYAGSGPIATDRNAVTLAAYVATGLFLVLIACFNYVNLATARSLLRSKEVGMRKILGASRLQLLAQFLGETLLTTAIAFVIALLVAAAGLPVFANLIGRKLTLAQLTTPEFVAFTVSLLIVVSLAAGAYPAAVLANFRPMQLFHNQRRSTGGRALFRHVMVGLQFSLTVVLLVSAAVVFTQARYLRNIDLGFKKEGLLIIRTDVTPDQVGLAETFKTELIQNPLFTGVTASDATPIGELELVEPLARVPSDPQSAKPVSSLQIDADFFRVYGVTPIAGRIYSDMSGADTPHRANEAGSFTEATLVVSEAATKELGFASAQKAIGQHVYGGFGNARTEYTIIGVVPDLKFFLGRKLTRPVIYHYAVVASPANSVRPAGLQPPLAIGEISARIRGGDLGAALDQARQAWAHLFPNKPLDYHFMDDVFDAANADDTRQSELFSFFTGLAIAVACLGLFGLASFVAVRRTREIAIRKVVGASTTRITRLLIWDFAKPVLLANIVAWPIAWMLMRQWLDGFAYRVDLSVWFFLGAGALAFLIALVTVIGQTLRAARTRPAEALAYE